MNTGIKFPFTRTARRRTLALILAAILLGFFASCSPRIGWGVVLWTVKGTSAKAGTIVPVYLKSNITKVYVIGIEEDKAERLEVPLWQIDMFGSRSAAKKRTAQMADLASVYMIAARDGLPVRESPSNANTVKRVYRLRENEMVKALKRVDGEALYTGSTKLPGDWYEVLTMDGTKGFVFSYTMRMFDESTGDAPVPQKPQTDAEAINTIFSRTWRPAWYASMMEEGMVDLDHFSLRFGLFGDAINKQIRVELPANSKVFQYNNISQYKDWLVFEPTDLRIKLDSPTSLLAAWGSAVEGEPEDTAGWRAGDSFIRFIVVDKDIRESIRAEEARRSEALGNFFAAVASIGGGKGDRAGMLEFSSPSAGTLELWPSGLYSWKDTLFLPANFTPAADDSAAEQKGTAVFGLRLSNDLSAQWQGGFSLYSDATGKRSDYVYRLEPTGLVLAKAIGAAPGLPLGETENRLGMATFGFSGKQ